MKLKLGVIFGGKSTEHEVSIMSAKNVLDNLDETKYDIFPIFIEKNGDWYTAKIDTTKKDSISNIIDYLKTLDVVFPVLHGKYGEDGTIQGLFELIGVPYVGCKVLSSSVCMDKVYTKMILDKANIKQAKSIYIKYINEEYILHSDDLTNRNVTIDELSDYVEKTLKYPVFVKPSNSGSSVGVNKAENKEELKNVISHASIFDNKILIEEKLIGKEIECAILGNMDVEATTVGEVLSAEDFYTYDAKYNNEESETLIPASISEDLINEVRKIAIKAFKAIDGTGLSRVDFFVNEENKEIYLNEINTLPGFTSISMYPQLWNHCGMSYIELLDKLITLALS